MLQVRAQMTESSAMGEGRILGPPTLPPILRPFVLARCTRCIIRNSFLLCSSHCPVDSHHDCVFFIVCLLIVYSFRGRCGLFRVVLALQRIVGIPEGVSCPRIMSEDQFR